jgi:hypothetical protein
VNARQLQTYAIEQALAAQNEIAPELMSFVGGDSKSAIDESIERMKSKTQQILANIQQAQVANVREGYGDQQLQVPDSMEDYSRFRLQRGMPGANNDLVSFLGGQ